MWERARVTADQVPRIKPEFLAEDRQALDDRCYAQAYLTDIASFIDAVFAPADIAASLSDVVKSYCRAWSLNRNAIRSASNARDVGSALGFLPSAK